MVIGERVVRRVHCRPDQVVRRLQVVAERGGIRREAWRLNFTRVGYVGSVAVPLMLDELARAGKLGPGDTVCTVAAPTQCVGVSRAAATARSMTSCSAAETCAGPSL